MATSKGLEKCLDRHNDIPKAISGLLKRKGIMNLATVGYPFTPLIKYIPLRYDNLEHWQRAEQRSVLQFSKGIINHENLEKLTNIILDIVKDNPKKWIVCFMPAASKERTEARYGRLSAYLAQVLPCPVTLKAIFNSVDAEPSHLTDNITHYRSFVYMVNDIYKRNVVVIDDVICSGTTFHHVGDKLMECGALSVHGVMFAISIHPRLPVKQKKR